MFTVKTTRNIDESQMEDLLTTVFETSACAYWLAATGKKDKGSSARAPQYIQDYPLLKDGWVEMIDLETDKKYRLNRRKIERGLQVMAKENPTALHDLITDNADGDTADIFMQCCLLSEVVYG